MKSAISALCALIAVSVFAQSSPTFRTTNDVREGTRGTLVGTVASVSETRNQFTVSPDDDRYGNVTVQGDSVSTTYSGFGGVINGSPEVFQGSAGITNVREGDRVEVRGVGQANTVINAEQVVLLGRSVQADQVGVGQTRTPMSPSTPTASSRASSDSATSHLGNVEGLVRQVSADDNRLVIETDRREMITVRGTSSTPVYYRQDVFHIANLEVGDRVRIQAESASSAGDIRARSIEVVKNVQEAPRGTTRDVGTLSGRVSRVERGTNIIRVQPDTVRGTEVRVDLTNALDSSGRRVRAADIQAGDRVSLSGSYNGDVYLASTFGFETAGSGSSVDIAVPPVRDRSGSLGTSEFGLVTLYGTVTQSLANAPQLMLRDQNGNRTLRVWVADDLVVRGRNAYTTADHLKDGDSLVIKAYRDVDGNYIAQTIRVR